MALTLVALALALALALVQALALAQTPLDGCVLSTQTWKCNFLYTIPILG